MLKNQAYLVPFLIIGYFEYFSFGKFGFICYIGLNIKKKLQTGKLNENTVIMLMRSVINYYVENDKVRKIQKEKRMKKIITSFSAFQTPPGIVMAFDAKKIAVILKLLKKLGRI